MTMQIRGKAEDKYIVYVIHIDTKEFTCKTLKNIDNTNKLVDMCQHVIKMNNKQLILI